jgi:hypothetical protein
VLYLHSLAHWSNWYPMYFNDFWITNIRKYEHIIYENSDFYVTGLRKNKSKVFWLKVTSINISCSTVPDCTCVDVNTPAVKNRLWTTVLVVLFHCCTLIWGLTNNNYNPYLLQFMSPCISTNFEWSTFSKYEHINIWELRLYVTGLRKKYIKSLLG